MNVGALFSGIGGIEYGFEREGFRTEWFVEYEPYAQAILKKHWPNTPIYGDIKTIDWERMPRVDILTGGFPCQDISNAGKRAGITGSRSSLWKEYLKAIRQLRPKYAVIENVAALTNRGLNVVLANLAEIGYDAEWYNLSASAVGAFHKRERIFIMAYPNSHGKMEQRRDNNNKEWNTKTKIQEWSNEFIRTNSTSNNDLANSELQRCVDGQTQKHTTNPKFTSLSLSLDCSSTLSNSKNDGWEQSIDQQSEDESFEGTSENNRRIRQGEAQGYWAVEPDVGRVAHGVPFRVDRIKCLGNAVVPAVAQAIGKAIKEYEETRA